jgi:hypothetical protein
MQQKINEYDNHGNTPLHLALMLNRHNCIIILLNYNCDVFSRNNSGWNPMDEASMIEDIDVIEKLSYLKWKEYIELLVKPNGILDEWNSTTPNLYIKYKLKGKTTIPLLKKFGAKDIQHLYKKGKNLRLDTTIAGIDSRNIPKIIRGKISVIFVYEEYCSMYKIYLIDHKKKVYQEFYPNIPEWYLTNFLRTKIAANMLYKFFLNLSEFNLKASKGNILKKNTKTFTMEDGKSYKCTCYRGKKASILIRKRNDEAVIDECESIIKKDFKEEEISKLKKDGKVEKSSSFISHHNTSKSSNNSDNDSDSDDSFDDSDDDSDIETSSKSNTTTNNNEKPIPEFLGDLYQNLDDYNYNDNDNGNDNNKNHHYQDPNKSVMYTINEDGETKTFEKITTMEDTLDWEQAYHEKYYKNSDLVYNFISGKKDNTKIKRLDHTEIEKLNLKKMTEDEYFNPSSTNELHMGRIMNISETNIIYKHKIKFWMAKENSHFPVSALDIKPILKYFMLILMDQVRSNDNANDIDKHTFEYLSNTLINKLQEKHSFPVKTSLPIYPSIALQVTCLNASKDIKYVPDDLFEIPNNYTAGNVFFEYINK